MTSNKGFTLIELAVVIAIIAILAAVAVPRFADTTTKAEEAMAKDLKSQLVSAAAIYTAEQGATPSSFADFVSKTTTATGTATLALGGTTCAPNTIPSASATAMSCAGTFKKLTNVSYTYNNGSITGTYKVGGTSTNF